jgi:hypothetical protein
VLRAVGYLPDLIEMLPHKLGLPVKDGRHVITSRRGVNARGIRGNPL